MLLEDKVAVIYGAGGSIGGAVARAFAREGARVFLSGRKAGLGEIIVSEPTLKAAGLDGSGLESRTLELKGISEPVLVRVMHGS